jgi:hypothetical protein
MGSTFQNFRPRHGIVRLVAVTAAALALAVATSAAFASSGISPRFDGHYRGEIVPSEISKGVCPSAASIDDMRVVDGHIQRGTRISADTDGGLKWQFDGFITEEGFVSGHAQMPTGRMAPFEGRVQEQGAVATLIGGIVDDATGCAWLVRLDLD